MQDQATNGGDAATPLGNFQSIKQPSNPVCLAITTGFWRLYPVSDVNQNGRNRCWR